MENILLECVSHLNDLFNAQASSLKWLERGPVKFQSPRANFSAWLRGEKGASFSVRSCVYFISNESKTLPFLKAFRIQ